jgi:hypothetical protein
MCLVAGSPGPPAPRPVFAILSLATAGLAHPPVDDDDAPLDFGRMLVALACVGVFLLCFRSRRSGIPVSARRRLEPTETSRALVDERDVHHRAEGPRLHRDAEPRSAATKRS